jgi:DNA-binding winged helix-turn-helix (wHTH) protein/WD40 repeat protein
VRARFGEHTLDTDERQLLQRGRPLHLTPKAFALLEYLIERRPRVLTKSQILERVWPSTFVTEANLASLVMEIRKALGDEAEAPRFIRTVRGFGYAFGAEVEVEPVSEAARGGVEERSPYPGLRSFTEEDAPVFFGRETEVEDLWERTRSRKMLAVIGPSGVGKTSFLRAGVIPKRLSGWGAVVSTPGNAPLRGLGRALGPDLAGDPLALGQLVGFEDPAVALDLVGRWRRTHAEALLVLDQFEELFTLNPEPTQVRFAQLLGRIASEADVHVVLSLRDDFLVRSCEQPPLAPVLKDLTVLLPLGREDLRRAIVEPAKERGYRFVDGALVDEMVFCVEGVRGALPLLAFAVARLWEERDREKKLLTREAYEEIGGVAGALAQHAEATMAGIGPERQGIVREIFRNLVTAHSTRAAADREELLSAFPDRPSAEEVLRELIDARLVTTYELPGREQEPTHHRVEVVHESLLRAWPRLVRWQAQDEEGAVLRDQLRQAAHLWDAKGRTPDVLWSGTAFREYELWRERYPGTLTVLEEEFARSMADRARRHRRRRRAIAGGVVAAALAVAAVTSVLWRRARSEALRAEAGQLLALGRAELEADSTAAVAYARKSLDIADTPAARAFAVEAFWRSPPARVLPVRRAAKDLGEDASFYRVLFSPDGRWFAARSRDRSLVLLFSRGGGPPRHVRVADPRCDAWGVNRGSDLLVAPGPGRTVRLWSLPELREVRTIDPGGLRSGAMIRGNTLLTFTRLGPGEPPPMLQRAWTLPDGGPRVLGRFNRAAKPWDIDRGATSWIFGDGRTIRLRSLDETGPIRERVLPLKDDALDFAISSTGERLVSLDRSGELRLWSLVPETPRVLRTLEGPRNPPVDFSILFDPQATRLVKPTADGGVSVFNLGDPADALPAVLRRRAAPLMGDVDPGGWLATNRGDEIDFWPLVAPRVRRLPGHTGGVFEGALAFTHDGRWLASAGRDALHLWPMDPADGRSRTVTCSSFCVSVATHPSRPEILVGSLGAELLDADGEKRRTLLDRWEGLPFIDTHDLAFDHEGRRVVAVPFKAQGLTDPKERVIRVFDLPSGDERVYSVAHLTDASWLGYFRVRFAADGRLLVAGQGGVFRLTLPKGPGGQVTSETLFVATAASFDLSADGRFLLVASSAVLGPLFDALLIFDLASHTSHPITTHGRRLKWATLDPSGRIVATGSADGIVRVGPATGEEPHLLLGHSGEVVAVAVSPDGRWLASAAGDEIRLWPMPDVTKPPLHTVPRAELLRRLDTWTNLRVVADPASSTGWTLEVGPFGGWKNVPEW